MVKINAICISPPLINSSCAWSSDLQQLQELYDSQYTGAVTTRTATLEGFKEDDSHKVAFTKATLSSINSYGYSPHPLKTYLSWIETMLSLRPPQWSAKPFIVSITASDPATLQSMVQAIQDLRNKLNDARSEQSRIAIELNTSCPNIPNSSPSGYNFSSLLPLLMVLKREYTKDETLTIGLKLPPFVYRKQFLEVVDGIRSLCINENAGHGTTGQCPFAFLTCTNTLGNSLLFSEQSSALLDHPTSQDFAVPTALGGLAGDSLHALALGNVYTFVQHLHKPDGGPMKDITIIGVGGVTSKEAAERMKRAGAGVVGCATLLGKEGVRAFELVSV